MNRRTKKKMMDLADRAMKVAAEMADVAVHLKQPTPLTMVTVSAKAVNAYRRAFHVDPDDFFDDWHKL